MRLFFSWQSDIPENKNIIRKALQKICNELDVEYTEDTRGEAGGEHVVDVLLRKISNSDIFVGDITIIGKAVNDDEMSNSNVTYELGYAEAKLGRNRIIMVMNEEHGTYEQMPFDLGKRLITRFKTTSNKLSKAEFDTFKKELFAKINSLLTAGKVILSEDVDIYGKTLLYWGFQLGDGFINDDYYTAAYSGLGQMAYSIGSWSWKMFFHKEYDQKSRTLFARAITKHT